MTKLVIFDCDGVLVDSEPAANAVLVEDLGARGLPVTLADCERHFVGSTMKDVARTARAMGADLPDDWVARIYERIYARLEQGTPAVPGVHALLDHLDATGMAYCVASNGQFRKMQITLGQTGLWERFDGRRFSGQSEGVVKPDPGLFLIAADRLGVAPDDCLVIEDSRSGAEAARRAGMRCLGYVPSGDGAHLAALGARIVRSMDEVPALLHC
ncbi:MAG: HAD family hydrolase [Marinibacterium sp.]